MYANELKDRLAYRKYPMEDGNRSFTDKLVLIKRVDKFSVLVQVSDTPGIDLLTIGPEYLDDGWADGATADIIREEYRELAEKLVNRWVTRDRPIFYPTGMSDESFTGHKVLIKSINDYSMTLMDEGNYEWTVGLIWLDNNWKILS